jgi:hypothetical protein
MKIRIRIKIWDLIPVGTLGSTDALIRSVA